MRKEDWNEVKGALKREIEMLTRDIDYIRSKIGRGIEDDYWPVRLKEQESLRLDKKAILMLMEKIDELGLTTARYVGRYSPVGEGVEA